MRRIRFQPFNEESAVRIYRNNLPHWRQPGATYFVTFRLADSIPQNILNQWRHEQSVWLRARHGITMDSDGGWQAEFASLPETARDAYHRHFNRQFHEQLDMGAGACLLRRPDCANVVKDCSAHFDGERYHLGDIVVMPNHVHLLITPSGPFELEAILQGIKGVSARDINRRLGRSGSLWQKDSYDHIVRTKTQLKRIQEYIRRNPEKAGLSTNECRLRVVDYDLD